MKREPKPTPGKWYFAPAESRQSRLSFGLAQSIVGVAPPSGSLFAELSDEIVLAVVVLPQEHGDVNANGRLMAAAKQMHAALVEAEALIAKNTYPCPDKPHSAWGILCRVREAIKAAGEPS